MQRMTPITWEEAINTLRVPQTIKNQLAEWIEDGKVPASKMLVRALHRDVIGATEACNRHYVDLASMPAIFHFLGWYAPKDCWGDAETFEKWRTINQKEG